MADIKRLQYTDGQLLDVTDFIEEQAYHREMRMRHNRLVHSWGIVEGLGVTIANNKPVIASGTALDKDGQELCLTSDVTLDLPADLKDTTRFVTAKFDTANSDEFKKDNQHLYWRRTIEQAKIEVTGGAAQEPPTNGSVIVLAKLIANAAGTITVDPSARSRSVSSRIDPAADLTVRGLLATGNLGVGTTSPENAEGWNRVLDVVHSINAKISVRASGIDARVMAHGGIYGALAGMLVGAKSNHALSLVTNAATRMTIDSAGKVGIGTTGPGAKLEVAVATTDDNTKPLVVGKGTTNYLTMLNNGNVGIGTNDPAANALRVATGSVRIELGEGKKLSLGGSGSFEVDAPDVVGGRLIVTSDGKVGMGAREPGAKLEVAVAATDGNTKPLVVGKGTTNYLTMLNNGNVGIGATAPVATLQIGETIGNRNNYDHSVSKLLIRAKDQNGGKTPAPTQSVLALVREGVSGEAYGNMVDFRLGRWEHVVANAPSRSQLDIYLTEDSFVPQHVMSLRANGNVGIGTPAPRGRLHVSEPAQTGTGAITSLGTKVTGSGTSFRTQLRVGDQITASGQTKVISAISSDKEEMTVDGAFSPDIATATAFAFSRPALVVKDGNVGIGTTDPITDLQFRHVVKDSRVRILRKAAKDHDAGNVPSELSLGIYDGGFGGVRIVNEQKKPLTEGNNQYICFHTHLAYEHQGERMRIAPSGNVGIGTSTPQGRLDVSGPSQTGTGTITSSGTKVTGSGTSLRTQLRVGDQITASGQTKVISAISSANEELTVDGAFSPDITGATGFAFSRPALVVKDGNVGIGTPDPGNYKIKVDGSSRLGATDYAANTVLSVAPGTIQFDAPNVPGGRLMINGSTGYVGIGATGPEAKLDVNGDMIVSGAIKQRHTEADLKAYLTDPKPSREKRELYDRMIKNLVKQNVAITQGCSYTAHQESPHLFAITQGVRNPHLDPTDIYICDLNTGAFKTFIIDHPLHKDKFLTHATLEGPEGAVYYRGTTWLENGRALIQLPNYFEALTRSEGRTILLSNVDGFDPLAVQTQDGAQIKDGRFIVVSSNNHSNQAFDWEVKAIRKDVQALEVEPLKSAIEVERFGPYAYAVPANAERMRAQPLDTYPSSAGPQAGVGTADISGACGPRSKITNVR